MDSDNIWTTIAFVYAQVQALWALSKNENRVPIISICDLTPLTCSGSVEGMSLEEQRGTLAAARANAQKALAKGDEDAGPLEASCPRARQTALGCDRDGRHYWHLNAASAFKGESFLTKQAMKIV